MKTSVSELQSLISYALSGYSDDCIDTGNNWYWNVLYSEMFNFPKAPSLAVGSSGKTEISRFAAMLKLLANHIETIDEG